MEKGLHDIKSQEMTTRLQAAIDSVTGEYDAILLAYGRCNNGVVGLKAGNISLVIPRIHDCIAAFFGSAALYAEFFNKHPGTFYRTSGWTERNTMPDNSIMSQLGLDFTYAELVVRYGKDDAEYLMQTLGNWTEQYRNLAYINTGLAVDREYSELTRDEAREKGMEFINITGNLRLLANLLNDNWNETDFLIVPPHHTIIADDSLHVINATYR